MRRSWSRCLFTLGILLAGSALVRLAEGQTVPAYPNAQVSFQPAVLDASGKLLAWYQPEKNLGYDRVMRLAWDFLETRVPIEQGKPDGLKIYLVNSTFDPATLQGAYWQHNPASTYGQFVDALLAWYPYSGDNAAVSVVKSMLDYQLAHGTTPAEWDWASVPFATSCGGDHEYGRCLSGEPREFYGGLEPDKIGELGIGYVLFYEFSGERRYLDAGIRCADALAKHVRPGDAAHTPWPFRVYGKTGEVLNGEEYGGMTVSAVRLFDELVRLKAGNAAAYRKARDVAWKWVLDYPLNEKSPAYDKWSGYFEDVEKDQEDVNQAIPTMTAYYMLTQADPKSVDPEWWLHAAHLIDWVRHTLGRGPFFGAWGIDEQGSPHFHCCSRAGEASDTSRWAAINAMYRARAGDGQAGEDAFRSLNYATYFIDSQGRVDCCGLRWYWWDDGYADYVRNFLWAEGAMPTLAPKGQDHLLYSSTVVQEVAYEERSIRYRTFDASGRQTLRLKQAPVQVTVDGKAIQRSKELSDEGYTVEPLNDGHDCIVRVRQEHGRAVVIGF